METAKLKRFAQFARRSLRDQVTAKLKLVLAEGSAARRENGAAVQALEEQILLHSQDQVIERVAYTWFNRFCALRFMDVNRYNSVGVLSPERGQFQPEILAEAKMGHIDSEMVPERTRQQIAALLDGKSPSREPQAEAYRLLVVAVCNFWNAAMPFLFARIADYTELLMPDDLLSGISVVTLTREAMTPDVCQDVEVIGWLYQFYISEKKDQVFEGMKKGKKITPENIPAATQLFSPHWIVRYLVENSLGRLWMLNRPQSRLVGRMDYYIKPEQPETDFLRIDSPEEIKLCDPACGSGHMLVYAFDLLYAIYEEEGYPSTEIPEKILSHNLFGIEIDERAGELAAFALTMKARSRNSRFLRKPVQPNICVLENVRFDDDELTQYRDFVGRDIFTDPLRSTLRQFEEADSFGSLIRPDLTDVANVRKILTETNMSGSLFLDQTHRKILRVLEQAGYLLPKYQIIVTNPPYMGSKGMDAALATWIKRNYADVKADLFSAFVIRGVELTLRNGVLGFVTPYVWLFLSSYEHMREFLLARCAITSVVQLEYNAFEPACIPVCLFTLHNATSDMPGDYIRLSEFKGYEAQRVRTLEAIGNPSCEWRFRARASDFVGIVGKPISYWISRKLRQLFKAELPIEYFAKARQGLATADTGRFLRLWHEVSVRKTSIAQLNMEKLQDSNEKWIPHQKGGTFRRWYGNNEYVVNWENNGEALRAFGTEVGGKPRSVLRNQESYFRPGITWSDLTIAKFAGRYFGPGFIFDTTGPSLFPREDISIDRLASYVNSGIFQKCLDVSLSGMHYNNGVVATMPCLISHPAVLAGAAYSKQAISKCKEDWDAYEISWDFGVLPMLHSDHRRSTIPATYIKIRNHWQAITSELKEIEEKNNSLYINAYGLGDELTPEVSLTDITLTCNPRYRYGGDRNNEDLEVLLRADTMKEFISYAVGCMFGRYALEKPGLILANQDDTIEQYLNHIPTPSFPADKDNVIPMLDGNWFPDDISERFKKFLRVTFSDEHFEENLNFIEQAIGRDIRTYFGRDFYNDHVKRYKKRPIYWLFSSPKGSFNALIYMHRYRPDTVSIVLNDYLREFRTKLTSRLDHLKRVETSGDASKAEKTKALKEIENLKKTIDELATWERDVLYPLASQQIEIDLDDGVKVNYAKFGAALKKIPGLDVSEE
jgi:type II restriction/modification system DNA methylase subunit YeeA